jgi:hypothetical protein
VSWSRNGDLPRNQSSIEGEQPKLPATNCDKTN